VTVAVALPRGDAPPALAFAVAGVAVDETAVVPTLRFRLDVETDAGATVRALSLGAQIRIAPLRRPYDPDAQARLADLFGEPSRWGSTAQTFLWTHATVNVPPFTGRATVDLPVACTYDLEVAATRYFAALADGAVPLEFLFSGTMFFDVDGRMQAARIPWDREATFALPVAVWRDLMERHFPGRAWLRLRRDTVDRLLLYKTRRALPTLDDALDALLPPE
jgi:uncharacterized protein DUF6084